jgi:hypothetical protein
VWVGGALAGQDHQAIMKRTTYSTGARPCVPGQVCQASAPRKSIGRLRCRLAASSCFTVHTPRLIEPKGKATADLGFLSHCRTLIISLG